MNSERRLSRSTDTLEALRLQLAACRGESSLRAMVLSDEDGVMLAAAGDDEACAEIAARLPLIGRRTQEFDGVLLSAQAGVPVRMQRFAVDEATLYLCTIGGHALDRVRELARGVGGAARILATA